MAKQTSEVVRCRYNKCKELHKSNELLKCEAVTGGKQKYYYHPDCFHTMHTISEIRDLFLQKVNPLLTGSQIGQLVSTIQKIVFDKHIDVDYLKFVVEYFVKYKPGALKHPPGLYYIIQNEDAKKAWEKQKNLQIKEKLEKSFQNNSTGIDINKTSFDYVAPKQRSFADILQ